MGADHKIGLQRGNLFRKPCRIFDRAALVDGRPIHLIDLDHLCTGYLLRNQFGDPVQVMVSIVFEVPAKQNRLAFQGTRTAGRLGRPDLDCARPDG